MVGFLGPLVSGSSRKWFIQNIKILNRRRADCTVTILNVLVYDYVFPERTACGDSELHHG